MGDVILTTSLLSYIQKSVPADEVILATSPLYAPLFAGDDRISRVIAINRSLAGAEEAAGVRWDRIIDLQNNSRSKRLRARAATGEIRTFSKLHWRRMALLFLGIDAYSGCNNVAGRYIEAFTGAPVKPSQIPPAELRFTADSVELPEDSRPALALFPAAAWKNKQWPATGYASVGSEFKNRGWQIVIFGGKADRAVIQRIVHDIGEHAYGFAGRFDLRRTGSLIGKCSLAVGNDTGLVHLARGCGVPAAVIYGATTRHFGFYPFGEPPFRTLETSVSCRPCHAHGGNLCMRGNRVCLTRIEPQQVIDALLDLSASCRSASS